MIPKILQKAELSLKSELKSLNEKETMTEAEKKAKSQTLNEKKV